MCQISGLSKLFLLAKQVGFFTVKVEIRNSAIVGECNCTMKRRLEILSMQRNLPFNQEKLSQKLNWSCENEILLLLCQIFNDSTNFRSLKLICSLEFSILGLFSSKFRSEKQELCIFVLIMYFVVN